MAKVLILVVVEDALRDKQERRSPRHIRVLILVVVEDALRGPHRGLLRVTHQGS